MTEFSLNCIIIFLKAQYQSLFYIAVTFCHTIMRGEVITQKYFDISFPMNYELEL